MEVSADTGVIIYDSKYGPFFTGEFAAPANEGHLPYLLIISAFLLSAFLIITFYRKRKARKLKMLIAAQTQTENVQTIISNAQDEQKQNLETAAHLQSKIKDPIKPLHK